MEEFLTDYVQMMAEAQEIDLNPAKVASIVNSLQQDEELWDTFDSFVNNAISKEGI